MQIKMTPRIRELVDILYHYEKEHGEIDENAPKEILDAYKELMDLDCRKLLTKQILSKNSESAFFFIPLIFAIKRILPSFCRIIKYN